MNYHKTKQLIKKIKNLNAILSDSSDTPSSIEKDLMLSYIRDLYEEVLDGSTYQSKATAEPKKSNSHPAVAPREVEIEEKPRQAVRVEVEASIPVKEEKVHEEVPQIEVKEDKISIEPTKVDDTREKLASLFNEQEKKELSHRLSQMPLADLSKSMGINEKIFTIRELFNGNQTAYDETIRALNEFSSYEEAKEHLINGIASVNEWHDEKRQNKAVNFLQLVKRRYI